MSDLLALMTSRGFQPRKTALAHDGEYVSSCPVCGDGGKGRASDRFHIWPGKKSGGLSVGRFWCRQCGISGDPIAFLQKVDSLTFPQACDDLGIILPKNNGTRARRYQPPPAPPAEPFSWQPTTYPEPGPIWQEKAGNLLADCRARLAAMPEAISWLESRGITRQMMETYRLGYNQSRKDGDRYRPRTAWGMEKKLVNGKDKKLWIPRGWVIPSFNGRDELVQLRIRRTDQDIEKFGKNIKYLPVDGSSQATMVLHPDAEVFICVESGFDAILLSGVMAGKVGVITSWNSSARPDTRTHSLLEKSTLILGGLDYDQGGDREQHWWKKQYPTYRRLPALPGGAKDPGDAVKAGVDLRKWIVDGLPRGLQIKLGFAGGNRLYRTNKKRKKSENSTPAAPSAAPTPGPHKPSGLEVYELELTSGKLVFITDDPGTWRKLRDEGKPVFSSNELARLKEATSTMDQKERAAYVLQVVEVKEVFSGYLRRGECFDQEAVI